MKPLSDAFRSEPHHTTIWKSQGKCVACNALPRELMCPRCGEPMCVPCLKAHEPTHLREIYIEKIALGKVKTGVPPEEMAEAMELRAKWAAEALANELKQNNEPERND